MRWQTVLALPAVGLVLWIVFAAVSFGEQVGDTWTNETTTTVTNGLVMVCFSAALFGVFIMSLIIGVALASRLIPRPTSMSYHEHHKGGLPAKGRGRGPEEWDGDPVVDSYGQRGGIVRIEQPPSGMRPLLGSNGYARGPLVQLPPPSSAFDGMDDGDDGRFGIRG